MSRENNRDSSPNRTSTDLSFLDGMRGRKPLPAFTRPTLAVIDVQKVFCDPSSPAYLPGWEACRLRVARLKEAWRSRRWPVVYTRHLQDDLPRSVFDHFFSRRLVKADPLSALVEVDDRTGWAKTHFSAWSNHSLAQLFSYGDALVLVGVQTQLCVLATAVEAAGHNVVPVVVADACAASAEELHENALRVLAAGHAYVCTTDEILDAIGKEPGCEHPAG